MTARPTFFDIRNKIMSWPGLSLAAKVIWVSLCQYSWTDGSCYHSRQTLAENHNMTLTLVKRARKELLDKGLINIFKRPLPATAVTFPFIQFHDIEQRDVNVVRLENQIGSKSTLSEPNKNSELQDQWGQNRPYNGVKIDPIDRVKIDPHKRKVLKENIKEEEEYTTNVVFVEHVPEGDISDTLAPAVETPPPTEQTTITKKQRSEIHRASREAQIAEIETNLQQYRDEYPTINVDVQFRKMVLWLTTKQKGKIRKDIRRTWINWLNSKLADYNVAQIGKQTPENRKLSQYEEYKKYVAKNANRP